MILLDTNIVIRVMRGDGTVGRHYCANLGDLAIPAMVLGELRYGVEKSERREDWLAGTVPDGLHRDSLRRRLQQCDNAEI